MTEDLKHGVRHEGGQLDVDVRAHAGGHDGFKHVQAATSVSENDPQSRKPARRMDEQRRQSERRTRAGMADQDHFVFERRLEQEIAPLRQGIEPLVLGLEFQCAKPVCLAATAHFLAEHAFRNKWVQAGRPGKSVWMRSQRSSNFVVFATVVLDDRKRNEQRTVNPRRIH